MALMNSAQIVYQKKKLCTDEKLQTLNVVALNYKNILHIESNNIY